jgi:hypothetical protein
MISNKDQVIANHLNESTLRSIYNFCSHYDLFTMGDKKDKNNYQIWKEVDLPNKSKNSRHFMIIVGLVS